MTYGAVQHSIAAYLEWNLFADMLGAVHALNYVLVEMEGIYQVSILWLQNIFYCTFIEFSFEDVIPPFGDVLDGIGYVKVMR